MKIWTQLEGHEFQLIAIFQVIIIGLLLFLAIIERPIYVSFSEKELARQIALALEKE